MHMPKNKTEDMTVFREKVCVTENTHERNGAGPEVIARERLQREGDRIIPRGGLEWLPRGGMEARIALHLGFRFIFL
eukprot:406367-Amorphochlora_amoeboformis.AAC.3